MEKKIGEIVELITTTAISSDINPDRIYFELDCLKDELLKNYNNNVSEINESNINISELEQKLQNLIETFNENKVKLRCYQESLTIIFPEIRK